jgi:hypothetical protein
MGSFQGMSNARRGFASNALKEGDYVVRIDKCENFEARQTGEKYKVTLTILAVTSGSHKEGEVVTTTFSRNHGLDIYLGNIKGFIAGVLGQPDEAVGENEAIKTLEPHNEMCGLVTRVRSIERQGKKTDEKGNPYSYCVYTWSPCLSPEDIKSTLGPERIKRFFPNGL